jgi:hypothetical protein
VPNLKAAVNAPQSRRFARFSEARWSRQRLECGGFSAAFWLVAPDQRQMDFGHGRLRLAEMGDQPAA